MDMDQKRKIRGEKKSKNDMKELENLCKLDEDYKTEKV